MHNIFQVRWALLVTLLALWPYQRNVRVVLVDFNSDDDGEATSLRELVSESCLEALQTGLLQFYRCDSQPTWHACICKNAAHYAACDSGWASHVVNLDCDRIVYPGFAPRLLRLFQQDTDAVAHFSNSWNSGTYGTVGCSVERFRALRGYDEDLLMRLRRAGCTLVRVLAANTVGYTLPNSEDGDVRKQALVKLQNVDVRYAGMKWGAMDQQNRRAMHAKAHIIARNTEPQWRPQEAVLVDLLASQPRPQAAAPALEARPQAAAQALEARPQAAAAALEARPRAAAAASQAPAVLLRPAPMRGLQREAPRRRTVTIMTLGLNRLKCLSGYDLDTPALVRAALSATGHHCDLAVDTRCLHDPEGLSEHLGVHPENIRQVVSNPALKSEVFRQVLVFLRRLQRREEDEVFVAFYCKSGRHRSVACSCIFERIFADMSWSVLETQHLSSWCWEWVKCQRRGVCRACFSPSALREKVLGEALLLWRESEPGPAAWW